jgi:iron(III) transport system permease protein
VAVVAQRAAPRARLSVSGLWLLLVPVILASAGIVGLLLFVVVLSFCRMDQGTIVGAAGWSNYEDLLTDPGFWRAVSNTAIFAGTTLVVSFAFGVPLAWLAERTNVPGRPLIWSAMLANLVVPGFLTAMGWLFLGHPRIGLINVLLMQLFHLTSGPLPVGNVYGMGIVQGLGLASLTFVLIAPSLRTMDPSLEEAGRMSGAATMRMLREITLPLIRPALMAAAIYIAIIAIGAFDVPAIIGLSNRVYTFSTFMFTKAYPVTGFADYTSLAAAGSLLIVMALCLSVVYSAILRKARQYEVVSGKAYRPRLVDLGGWKLPAVLFVVAYITLAFVLPFLMTLVNALMPFAQPLSADALQTISLDNFTHIPWELVLRGALHTLEVVAVVPFVVVLLSIAFSWIVLRTRLRGRFVFDAIAFLPHAVPATLFGIGASLAALFVLQKILPIYGTVFLLMAVYSIAWISFGTRMINGSLIQIHSELIEAGQLSGGDLFAVLGEIVAPLLRPATFGLWIYLALFAMRELTMAAFVTTPSNLTLPMVAWFLWQNGSLTQAAAVAVIIVVALTPLLVLCFSVGRRAEAMFQ